MIVFLLMIRRPPRSTRTDTLFPYTTLLRSWRGVGETVDPRAMPLTGLANAAIDRIAGGPASFAAGLARYGENDLLCYRAESPPDLVARQAASWDPLPDWARRRYDVHFEVTTGIIRSDERRVGKECVSTWRSGWSRDT